MGIDLLRKKYHQELCEQIIRLNSEGDIKYLNFADKGNKTSIKTAQLTLSNMGCDPASGKIHSQTIGRLFEEVTKDFLEKSFHLLRHLRPGKWTYSTQNTIASFAQFAHLAKIEELIKEQNVLKTVFGSDYIVKPDIVIGRCPVADNEINQYGAALTDEGKVAKYSPLRKVNQTRPILHASISCKWTLRSDRAQNTRTEALNLIRNRKGPMAHVSAVTAEPMPSRLSALALGTGDLDCVYHIALPELQKALEELDNETALDMLQILVEGDRLRDISDLPLDIAI